MPSPESPAKRSVRPCRGGRAAPGTVDFGEKLDIRCRVSRSRTAPRVRVRWEVVDRAGEVLHQVMDDSLDGEDAERPAVVNDRQVTVAPLDHPANGDADRIFWIDR